jgi:hypothetical protein
VVEITIFVEGATLEHANHNAQTMANSQRFRESFRRLFSSAFPNHDELRIMIENGSSNNQTVTFFKNAAAENAQTLLLLDLDASKPERNNRLNNLELTDLKSRVFFMIQKMEAWILSQPDKIEACFTHYRYGNARISEDSNLAGIHPENIRHPDDLLNTILSRYFRYQKQDKTLKLKYRGGKLKLAPELIELLDFEQLSADFDDVRFMRLEIRRLIDNGP